MSFNTDLGWHKSNMTSESKADPDPLVEIEFNIAEAPLSSAAAALVSEARALEKEVQCFDFVPSNYENAWAALSALPPGRFCEWGSGLGVVTALASLLGFEACGIELDAELAEHARQLLRRHGVDAEIRAASYLEIVEPARYYYVYAWPGQQRLVEQRFDEIAPARAQLLICQGQDDLRIKMRRAEAP
jgi:hypothetical protein